MKRTLIALVASAALVTGTLATPQQAKADPISAWWLVPAVLGGLWLGGAWASNRAYAYSGPYAYAGAGYTPVSATWGTTGGWSNCWMERRRVGGVWRNAQVCIR
jgi:hypothetical protein